MSRYRWPPRAKSPDSASERMSWNAQTDGLLLPQAVSAARRAREPVARGAPQPGPPLWVPIGPSTVIRGQATAQPRVSGRVRDVAVSPNGLRVYAATANAGVWFSGDEGNTWSPIGGWYTTPEGPQAPRGAHALTCGCLLVTFGNAEDGSEDDVYVGTGEIRSGAQGTPGAELAGVGVLRLVASLPDALANPFGDHWRREARNLAGRGIFRLARKPGGGPETLVAATSGGLFFRTGPFVTDADWTRSPSPPFDHELEEAKWTTDVVWTEDPARLWVAFVDNTMFSDTNVYVSNAGPDAPFHEIDLDDVVSSGRLGLAVAPKANPADPTRIYVLGSGPRLWRIEGLEATRIRNVPERLFGETSKKDQSRYDLALGVHPTDPDLIVIGGSGTHTADGAWNASIYRCRVSGSGDDLTLDFAAANQEHPSRDPTYVGQFVHADVHQLRFVEAPIAVDPARLWVACDGGLFYSTRAGDPGSFTPRNTGLATLEPGYITSHPTNPGTMVAGTQDNGTLERVGDTVWRLAIGGDGGGVAYNPRHPQYFAAQYTNSAWNANVGTFPPPVRRPGISEDDYEDEDDRSSFYSGCDVRQAAAPTRVRLALGTNRVWLMDDWRPGQPVNLATKINTWVTLPSGADPRAADPDDSGTDVLDSDFGAVLACRWIDDERLLVLYSRMVVLYTETVGWDYDALTPEAPSHCGELENSDLPEGETSSFLPPLGSWSDIVPHDPERGEYGSCYVAATGDAEIDGNTINPADRMDTLWWFDGDETWHKTGLRNDATPESRGTPAPAYAVLLDPDDPDVVYVGTALGVWRGHLTFTDETPDWRWESFSNGLPEAPVHDLSIFQNGGLKLLRAAIQARGVWEVDLSAAPTPTARTYLRVHPVDTRRVTPTDLANPFWEGFGDSYSWHESPDIRVRPAPFDPFDLPPDPPAAPPFPWTSATFVEPYTLWVFQMAFHSRDPIVVPDGRWTDLFDARLVADNPAIGSRITEARWRSTVTEFTAFGAPWDGPEPTEADLAERVIERKTNFTEGAVTEEFTSADRIRYRVDVLVHRRDLRPLPPADVRVALLTCPLPAPGGPLAYAAFGIDDPWKAAVAAFLRGTGPATAIPVPWQVADAAFGVRNPSHPLDARLPRAVTFDLDLTSMPGAPAPGLLLLAVVHATGDELTVGQMTGGTVRELVLNCHHVAAKILEF
jgi:hypothetical protein